MTKAEKNNTGEAIPVLTCSKHFGFVDSLGFFKKQVFSNDTSTYKIIKKGQIGYPANHSHTDYIRLLEAFWGYFRPIEPPPCEQC